MSEQNVFPKKWEKVLKDLPEFKETADQSSKEDLKKIIVQAEGNIYNLEADKEKDEKLIAAREVMKDLSAGYSDAMKVQTAKIKYAMFLLETKGEEIGSTDDEEKE